MGISSCSRNRVQSHVAFLPHPASVHMTDVIVWVWMVWVSGRLLIYLGGEYVSALSQLFLSG